MAGRCTSQQGAAAGLHARCSLIAAHSCTSGTPPICGLSRLPAPHLCFSPMAAMVCPICLIGTPGPHTLMAAGSRRGRGCMVTQICSPDRLGRLHIHAAGAAANGGSRITALIQKPASCTCSCHHSSLTTPQLMLPPQQHHPPASSASLVASHSWRAAGGTLPT